MNRAIVTDIAGTTRDIITETLDFDGIPVTLIDTAGIRDGKQIDKVEEIGIEYSKKAADEADLILFMYDSSQGLNDDDEAILELIKDKKHVKIANKADLTEANSNYTGEQIKFSTVTKQGIDELKIQIKNIIGEKSIEDVEFVTNSRQQACLLSAKESLTQALRAIEINELQDLISIDIKSALLHLDEITGEVITDDILNNIFDNFCIGK